MSSQLNGSWTFDVELSERQDVYYTLCNPHPHHHHHHHHYLFSRLDPSIDGSNFSIVVFENVPEVGIIYWDISTSLLWIDQVLDMIPEETCADFGNEFGVWEGLNNSSHENFPSKGPPPMEASQSF